VTSPEGQNRVQSYILSRIVNDSTRGAKRFIESCCHQRPASLILVLDLRIRSAPLEVRPNLSPLLTRHPPDRLRRCRFAAAPAPIRGKRGRARLAIRAVPNVFFSRKSSKQGFVSNLVREQSPNPESRCRRKIADKHGCAPSDDLAGFGGAAPKSNKEWLPQQP
jgi:hypothetical protein